MAEHDPLQKLIEAAARSARQSVDADGGDISPIRASVVEAAAALRSAFGDRALEQARRMEKTASDQLFARLVSSELEAGGGDA